MLHVAVGVVVSRSGEVLIARRPLGKHLGGLWEFPGGKVESGEHVQHALARELLEEINLQILSAEKLIQIKHDYRDKSVFLDVYRVTEFEGLAKGNEGQEVIWVKITELNNYQFPAANAAIIAAIQLPERILITGEFRNTADFLSRLERALGQTNNVEAVQVRAPWLSNVDYVALCNEINNKFASQVSNVKFFANCEPEIFSDTGLENYHLNSARLLRAEVRTEARTKEKSALPDCLWVSASVHTARELEFAQAVGVDFVYCSPVNETSSHPGASVLGWEKFTDFVEHSTVPVYALGGMTVRELAKAKACGAQGIASIGEFWPDAGL